MVKIQIILISVIETNKYIAGGKGLKIWFGFFYISAQQHEDSECNGRKGFPDFRS